MLGRTTDEENAFIEAEYFADDRALEALAAEEDALIEDYLAQRLDDGARAQFERVYLASPYHRRRVAVVRMLEVAAAGSMRRRHRAWANRALWYGGLAAAAAVLLATTLWMSPGTPAPDSIARDIPLPASPAVPDPPPPGPVLATPRIVAVLLSPVAVRAVGDAPTLVIPGGTDIVALDLQGQLPAEAGTLRGVVRTVSGDEVAQRVAATSAALPPGVVARLEIPAALLPPEDYVIILRAGEVGGEREMERYFLRIRR